MVQHETNNDPKAVLFFCYFEVEFLVQILNFKLKTRRPQHFYLKQKLQNHKKYSV